MESSQRMEKTRGWEEKGLGSSQRMEKGWGVLRSTKFGFSKFKCDPPNRDLVN